MSMIFCFESLETTTKEKLLSKQAQDLLDSKSDMDLVVCKYLKLMSPALIMNRKTNLS